MKKLIFLLVFILTITLFACDGTETPDTGSGDGDPGYIDGGTTDDGTTDDGTTNDGTTNDGTTNDGTTNDGTTNDGTTNDGTCTSHKDDDNNGQCDNCEISVIVVLDFYALNDLHGKLDDNDSSVGVDELTTYLKNAYNTDDAAIILSSGDMWQGSPESNLTKGFIITEWMNELDFVSMTLGNHEFDWGNGYITQNAAIAEFPILAINIYDIATGERADYCQPSVMVERDGIKIGVIGAIGDCKSSISASLVSDVDFKVGSELTSLVKAESERLRSLGAEFIVFSVHGDYDEYDPALSNGYVDLVFEGHTHQSYVETDRYGIYHLQNGGYDNGISHVEVKLNFANDSFSVNIAEVVENYEYAHLSDDPIVDELLEKYDEQISIASRPVGNNPSYMSGMDIKQLVADLYLEAGLKAWSDDYDIVLGGGYISVRSPGYLSAGTVIYGDLMDILPFDNAVVLCSISGRNLLDKFINNDNANYFLAYSSYGSSVADNINPNATYYIITDSYSLDYAANGLTFIDKYENGNVYARDLVAEYLGDDDDPTPPAPPVDPDPPVVPDPPVDPNYTLTSIPDILDLGLSLVQGESTSEKYYVRGVIISDPQATYGNTYIMDEEGNKLYVYGMYSEDGTLYGSLTEKPIFGDTVVLSGVVMRYYNQTTGEEKIEIKDTTIVSLTRAQFNTLTSISDVIGIGEGLERGYETVDKFYVRGKIAEIPDAKWGNTYIEDENGNRVYVYGIISDDGGLFNTIENQPKLGDTVVLCGVIMHYYNDSTGEEKVEIKNATIALLIPADNV